MIDAKIGMNGSIKETVLTHEKSSDCIPETWTKWDCLKTRIWTPNIWEMPAAMIVPEIKSKLLLLVEIAIANIRDKAGINPYDNWVASIPIR